MAEDGLDQACRFDYQDISKDRKGAMDKCLIAMKEDVASWLSGILSVEITVETLMEDLDTGVVLCRLANMIQITGEEFLLHNCAIDKDSFPSCGVTFKERTAFRGSFIARDNVANFIRWCRELGVPDILMFETEDLVLHKNEKSVILTLMDVARLSVRFGLEPPDLVRLENEIDQEIEQQPPEIAEEPMARLKKKHKSHSLDDLVYQVLDQCTCPSRYPVLRIAEGKYRVGENKSLIFVRVMRKHVMVRVGGGWDTLERYFDKHDPCKISERQRRGSIRSPRARSGSDVIGRSPSTLSVSSSDSHDSTGPPATHGRTACWNSSHGSATQLKSPRDGARQRAADASPSRSPSPSSPRLQSRTRRDTASRDTPPRTIQTQSRARLARKSKSMQNLSSFAEEGGRLGPSYSKPTSCSIRKQSQCGPEKSTGVPGQTRRQSSATSPRKPSTAGSPGDRLSSSGPCPQRAAPARVSRSASFGSRPRPMVPVVEIRPRTAGNSRPARETQRRTSTASPRKVEKSDDIRPREPSATRRSSTAVPDGKANLPGSPKPGPKSAHERQERSRKLSVSKIPSPRQQTETTSKIPSAQQRTEPTRRQTKGALNQANTHRNTPSTSGNRKTSTTQQRTVANSTAGKTRTKNERASPSLLRRENRPTNQKKEPPTKAGENDGKERILKDHTNVNREKEMENGVEGRETVEEGEMLNGASPGESTSHVTSDGHVSVTSDGHVGAQSAIGSDNLNENNTSAREIDDIFTIEVSSPDSDRDPQNPVTNGRKASEGSIETVSDFTSDLMSDFTDTDYDVRSQRYSGLSEASSDVSFGTSPAWKLFHSVDHERNFLERSMEQGSPELGTSPVKDCLMNLNLQGSLTPTMRRRIFEVPVENNSHDSPADVLSHPSDKAKFFDVEKYNDLSPEEEDTTVGSPRKLSLVKSLISSIEKRGTGAGDAPRTNKHTTATKRAAPERAGKKNPDEPAAVQRVMLSPEPSRASHFSFDEQDKDDFTEKNEETVEQRGTGHEEPASPNDVIPSHVVHDENRNITSALPNDSKDSSLNSQRVPGEKPYEASHTRDEGKTRKLSRDKRGRVKDLDVFPRPQRQFTLEEMIEDMLPADGEAKGTGDQRVMSPEPHFQAWL